MVRFLRFIVLLLIAGVLPGVPAHAVTAAPRSAPLFNGSVLAIAYLGDTVYVGGSFTSAVSGGRTYRRERLAAFDARSGALRRWAPSADRTVRALATIGNSVYAAGDFGRVAGLRRDSVARIDAATGAVGTFAHTVMGTAYALSIGGGRLYLGGRFTAVDGVRRANLAAFALPRGTLDGGWRPAAAGTVHAVLAYGSRVFVGGLFSGHLAAFTSAGGPDRSFRARPETVVNAIAADTGGVYVATGGRGGGAIAFTSTGVTRWQRVFDGDAVAVATMGGVAYVGGHFDHACRTVRNGSMGACSEGSVARVKLAAVRADGRLTAWAPAANGVVGVRALAANRLTGVLSAGGDFTMINGLDRQRLATFH